ncbi:MAG: MBL fold metallo-hydrolase [Melioribacteraceae bacterium]|nr:MBL fold metallo-hydrolase [Melioribacteraceae bacterium]MCF8413264.1 MBL fold metallo-hydrolase [Melioribacteraceae bacterium]MCF8431737.1 MBL fold metallo-hydrolase [Melioribacteraceae bacterium]
MVEYPVKIIALGGASDIGGSCFYLRLGETGIIFDCGIHPRKKGKESIPDLESLENEPIDFVFISHAHQDHIGALPYLIKKFPHIKIFSTPQTKELASLVLHNSSKILKKELGTKSELKPYELEEVDLLVQSITEYYYNEPFILNSIKNFDEEITVTFYDAGHVLGSVSILIGWKGKNIFYSGDVNNSPQSLMNGSKIPKMNTDLSFIETTYGSQNNDEAQSWDETSKLFAKDINQVINRGGSLLIPVFSLGKFQEILLLIHNLMESGLVGLTNIYTHGLGKSLSKIYDSNRYLVNRNYKDVKLKDIPQIRISEIRNLSRLLSNPGIILASSGMMIKNTVSNEIAQFFLSNEKFAIFSVGYMDPETQGYRVMNAAKGDKIALNGNNPVKVLCTLKKFSFASHSSRKEIVSLIKKVNPKNLILIHGEEQSIKNIGSDVLEKYRHIKVYAPSLGDSIILTI